MRKIFERGAISYNFNDPLQKAVGKGDSFVDEHESFYVNAMRIMRDAEQGYDRCADFRILGQSARAAVLEQIHAFQTSKTRVSEKTIKL